MFNSGSIYRVFNSLLGVSDHLYLYCYAPTLWIKPFQTHYNSSTAGWPFQLVSLHISVYTLSVWHLNSLWGRSFLRPRRHILSWSPLLRETLPSSTQQDLQSDQTAVLYILRSPFLLRVVFSQQFPLLIIRSMASRSCSSPRAAPDQRGNIKSQDIMLSLARYSTQAFIIHFNLPIVVVGHSYFPIFILSPAITLHNNKNKDRIVPAPDFLLRNAIWMPACLIQLIVSDYVSPKTTSDDGREQQHPWQFQRQIPPQSISLSLNLSQISS